MWRALLVLCLLASTADAQPVITWRPPMNCATNDVLKWNGTTWTCSGGAAVTGSGTTNLVAKWTSATGLGNSSITDDGTNITLNPAGGLITLGVGADDTLVGDQLGVRISPGGTAALYVDGSGLTYAANLIGAATINGNTTVTRDDAASHTNRPVLSVTNTSVAGGLNHRADVSFNVADSGGVMRNAVIEAEGQYLFVGAVAGLVSTSPLFQNDGNTVLGNAVGDELDVNGDLSKFGSTSGDGATYINDGTINFQYTTNATATGVINHYGYNGGTTQFRNLNIRDGKGADVAIFTGSSKQLDLGGALNVVGDVLVGTNNTGNHTLGIRSGSNGTGAINFSDDSGAANNGVVLYDHSVDAMDFKTNAIGRLSIDSAGSIFAGDSSRSVIADNVNVLTIGNTGTAQTTTGKSLITLSHTGSFDTSGGAKVAAGLNVSMTSTRSAGGSNLTNKALLITSSGAQSNTAIETDDGDNHFNKTSGFSEFYNHVYYTGTAPTLSTCGTSPTIVGNDHRGTITTGTGGPTACTMTFATAYTTNAPVCVVGVQTTTFPGWPYITARSTTAITYSFAAAASSATFFYSCDGTL